ncbi:MAG TPA: hypothetical protein VH105_23640 [Burkholderiales bacterium]|nr:hypothetical protein [Burkholderiales bacterium]
MSGKLHFSSSNGPAEIQLADVSGLRDLREVLRKGLEDFGDARHYILAHSHGGNVVVKALSEDDYLSKRISGVCCMATPFLVALRARGPVDSNLWQKLPSYSLRVLAIVMPAALSTTFVVLKLIKQEYITLETESLLLAVSIGIFTLVSWIFSERMRKSLIDAEGIPLALHEKLLVIRASGDEAAAALGFSYILRFALQSLWRVCVRLLLWPFRQIALFTDGKSHALGIIGIVSFCFGLAIFLFAPELHYPLDEGPLSWLIAVLAITVIAALLVLAVNKTAKTIDFVTTWILYVPIDFLCSLVTIPFGIESVFAASLVSVSAEATIPVSDRITTTTIAQLKFCGRTSLQHFVYDDENTRALIAEWLK